MANKLKMFVTNIWEKASQERGHPHHHSLLYSSPTISPSTTVTNFSSIQSIQSIQSTRSVQSRIHQQYFSKMGTKEQNMIIGAGEIAPLNNGTVCGTDEKKFVAQSINSEYSPYTPTTVVIPSTPEEDSNSSSSSQRKPVNFAKQALAALSVSIGSLTVGFVSAYTSTALTSIRADETAPFTVNEEQESWIGSLMPLSALIGGIVGGPLIEYMGRKRTILLSAFPFIASWLMIAFAVNVEMIYAARILSGFNVGVASLAFPVYLGETLQPEVRGMLGLLPTALGNIGILLCFVAGSILKWSHLALFASFLPIPFLILMCVIPETPRWYFTKGRKDDAETALVWLRGKNVDVSEELTEIEKSQVEADKNQTSNGISELFQHQYLKPLMISLGLMFFQQLSGINAVIFYTVEIFQDAGSTINPNLCTIIVGLVNFGSVFVATMLIDRLGRKILLYISSISMTITLVTLSIFFYLKELKYDLSAYGWIPLASFVVYIIAFSLGFGPIPWLMLGEILPANVRGPAASIATAFNWSCAFIVTKAFKDLTLMIGTYSTFGIFAKVCFIAFFFTLFCVPETQGRTLEDIEKALTGQKVRRMSSVINIKPMPTAC